MDRTFVFKHADHNCVYITKTKHEAVIQHILKFVDAEKKSIINNSPDLLTVNLTDGHEVFVKWCLLDRYWKAHNSIDELPVNGSV